jgi:4-amino-4-deoxy-L-arabinose transferase-like glycosyltransferase
VSKPAVISISPAPSKRAQAETPNSKDGLGIVWLTVIFVIAAALRLWFNFATAHPSIAFSCDAAEYLRNAQTLSTLANMPEGFWVKAGSYLFGTASAETVSSVRSAFSSFGDFFISGPVFPLYLLSCYTLTGTACDISNWTIPVAVQALLCSFTCNLIALIGAHCWNRRTGLIAGLMAAFYPAFILNSGRLYSESFACFLLCLTVWLTVRGNTFSGNPPGAILLTGIGAIALQLTRSIMFVLSLVLIPITFIQNRTRRPWLSLAILLSGCACIALPWLGLQQLAFGKGGLVVDRVSHYNFATGNNVDTQGWLSYPYPDYSGVDQKSFLQLAKENLQKSPSRYFKLLLDKPLRLFKFPWNDFRTEIGPLPEYGQVFIHQTVVLLACAGLLVSFVVQSGTAPTFTQLMSRSFLVGLLLFQSVYLAFITVPRYNLTLMPLLILFAASAATTVEQTFKGSSYKRGLWLSLCLIVLFLSQKLDLTPIAVQLLGAQQAFAGMLAVCALKTVAFAAAVWAIWKAIAELSGLRQLARAGTIALAILLFPAICLPLRAHGRWQEWQCPLTVKGQVANQEITLPPGSLADLKQRQCYLLVNAASASELNNGLDVQVNGEPVACTVVPNLPFLQNLSKMSQQGKHNLYLECEYIFECLTFAAGISNMELRQWFLIPIPASIIAAQPASIPLKVTLTKTNHQPTTLFGAYNTAAGLKSIPSPILYSWEKAFYGVENDRGFSDTSLDMTLPASPGPLNETDLSPLPGRQSGDFYVRLLAAPRPSSGAGAYLNRLCRYPIPYGKSVKVTLLPQYEDDDCWLVRLSGKASCNIAAISAGMRVTFRSRTAKDQLYSYDTPWCPRRITADGNEAKFDIAFPLVPSALPGKLQEMEIAFQPLKNPAKSVEFHDVELEVLAMPSLPMNPGHKIF